MQLGRTRCPRPVASVRHHGRHPGDAYRTLSNAVALNEAVKTVLRKVHLDETLFVLTGDHSHTLTSSGYARNGNSILGTSVDVKVMFAAAGKSYTTLSFADGPGSTAPKVMAPVTTAAPLAEDRSR